MKRYVLIILLGCLFLPESIHAVKYIENKSEETTMEGHKNQENALKEGLAQEDIIVQITDEGYVTSHGDHYHYYDGLVPFDGIFSTELLAPTSYQFDDQDIEAELKDGFLIRFDGKYYIYVEDMAHASHLRSKNEIKLQFNGLDPLYAKKVDQYLLEQGVEKFILVSSSQRLMQDYPKLKGKVTYLFDRGYILHEGDDYFVVLDFEFSQFDFEPEILIDALKDEDQVLLDRIDHQIIKDSNQEVKLYQN